VFRVRIAAGKRGGDVGQASGGKPLERINQAFNRTKGIDS
jgi:hypothetical protein